MNLGALGRLNLGDWLAGWRVDWFLASLPPGVSGLDGGLAKYFGLELDGFRATNWPRWHRVPISVEGPRSSASTVQMVWPRVRGVQVAHLDWLGQYLRGQRPPWNRLLPDLAQERP
jgi:hypothetical protein